MGQKRALIASTVVIAGLVVVTGLAATGAAVAQTSPDLAIAYDEGGAGADGPSPFSEEFQVAVTKGTLEFGSNASTELRVVNRDTGESVTLAPTENQSTVTVGSEGAIDLNAGDVIDLAGSDLSPEVTLSGPDTGITRVGVNVTSGTLEAFGPDTFEPYTIQVLDGEGAVLAETNAQLHGIRYEADIAYNGSVLTVTRDPGIQDDWFVELTQNGERLTTLQADASGNRLVAFTNGTGFNASETLRVQIYRNETDPQGKRLINLFYVGGISAENRVDGSLNVTLPDDTGSTNGTDGTDAGPSIPDDAVYGPGSAAASFDGNGDGRIAISELGSAATAYANGDISVSELGNVATAFAGS